MISKSGIFEFSHFPNLRNFKNRKSSENLFQIKNKAISIIYKSYVVYIDIAYH